MVVSIMETQLRLLSLIWEEKGFEWAHQMCKLETLVEGLVGKYWQGEKLCKMWQIGEWTVTAKLGMENRYYPKKEEWKCKGLS